MGNRLQKHLTSRQSTSESQRENSAIFVPGLRVQPSAGPWSTSAGRDIALSKCQQWLRLLTYHPTDCKIIIHMQNAFFILQVLSFY